jgi:hypothetical protein
MSSAVDQVMIDGGDGSCHSCDSGTRGPGSGRRAPYRGAAACTTPRRMPPRAGPGSRGSARRSARRWGVPSAHVRRQHHRGVPLGRVMSIGHRALRRGILGSPLVRPGRAGRQLPVVLEQVVLIPVVPPRRLAGPRALQPAGDRARAVAISVLPAQALLLNRGRLGLPAGFQGLLSEARADPSRVTGFLLGG